MSREEQRRQLDLLNGLNRLHQEQHSHNNELSARIESYELAYRMQKNAPEAVDLNGETQDMQTMYGVGEKDTDRFGRACLMARRLVERGVRYVQIFHANWDTHGGNDGRHRTLCKQTDKPIGGLLTDLKQRGLLDDTLVQWGGEFGRTPIGTGGRDHHAVAFTMWLAGGGIKGGQTFGETDEFGFRNRPETLSTSTIFTPRCSINLASITSDSRFATRVATIASRMSKGEWSKSCCAEYARVIVFSGCRNRIVSWALLGKLRMSTSSHSLVAQPSREVARKLLCGNNLKQLGTTLPTTTCPIRRGIGAKAGGRDTFCRSQWRRFYLARYNREGPFYAQVTTFAIEQSMKVDELNNTLQTRTSFFMKPAAFTLSAVAALMIGTADAADTLPALTNDQPAKNFAEMWTGFDPRAEPLETETLKEWEQDGIVMRIVRFRIGVFKGKKATLAAIYGYPKEAAMSGTKVPGLVQIHGGGQYAHYNSCLLNAKRGYATVSIAWAGRISAPGYAVSPAGSETLLGQQDRRSQLQTDNRLGCCRWLSCPGTKCWKCFPQCKIGRVDFGFR